MSAAAVICEEHKAKTRWVIVKGRDCNVAVHTFFLPRHWEANSVQETRSAEGAQKVLQEVIFSLYNNVFSAQALGSQFSTRNPIGRGAPKKSAGLLVCWFADHAPWRMIMYHDV